MAGRSRAVSGVSGILTASSYVPAASACPAGAARSMVQESPGRVIVTRRALWSAEAVTSIVSPWPGPYQRAWSSKPSPWSPYQENSPCGISAAWAVPVAASGSVRAAASTAAARAVARAGMRNFTVCPREELKIEK